MVWLIGISLNNTTSSGGMNLGTKLTSYFKIQDSDFIMHEHGQCHSVKNDCRTHKGEAIWICMMVFLLLFFFCFVFFFLFFAWPDLFSNLTAAGFCFHCTMYKAASWTFFTECPSRNLKKKKKKKKTFSNSESNGPMHNARVHLNRH